MQFVPVPNAGEFHLIFEYAGQICQNVVHASHGVNPFTEVTLAAVCTSISDWWNTEMKAAVNDSLTLQRIEAFALDSQSAPAIVSVDGLPLTGTNAGDAFPNNVTCAVKWSTGLRGRSYRGRTYHLGLCRTQADGNILQSGFITTMAGIYAALKTAIESSGDTMVVVSRFHNKAPRTTGIATEIIGVSIDQVLDSQRRRLPGRGQ